MQCSQPACYLLTFVTGPPGSRRKTSLCSQEVPGAACSPPHPSSPHAQFQELHSCNPPADVSASSLGAKPIGDGELLMTPPSLGASPFFSLTLSPCRQARPRPFLRSETRCKRPRQQQVRARARVLVLLRVYFCENVHASCNFYPKSCRKLLFPGPVHVRATLPCCLRFWPAFPPSMFAM